MTRQRGRPAREVRRTALLVGEGLAEQVFLSHMKVLFVERGRLQVTVKNAKGKGGAHVLDYTRRQGQQAAYDHLTALLDTDTDWGDEQRQLAQEWGIDVIEAHPCLEAMLLRIAGHRVPRRTAACKKAFRRQFGDDAHSPQVYERHFQKDLLDQACGLVPELERLRQILQP